MTNLAIEYFPLDRYGIKLMSMGFLVSPETAMIWRGPMVHKYLTAFLTQIEWGEPRHRRSLGIP